MDDGRFAFTLRAEEGYRFTVDFDIEGVPPLRTDEPPPLGEGEGPNPSRLLAAAVANCLSASLLFCLRKARIEPDGLETEVEVETVRNEHGRLRIGTVKVRLHPGVSEDELKKMERCTGLFEDFCVVTQSVRDGLEVEVDVVPERVPVG